MQGIAEFISTDTKVDYINNLLGVGFDTIDFGSFVSPKAIPQLKDTSEVLDRLTVDTRSKLLAIVANERGAIEAASKERIDYLGFPFSISEEFQKRNTNKSIEQSLSAVEGIQNLCHQNGKTLVLYISMAFGNPYNELWHPELALSWSHRLHRDLGIEIIALSDTIGVSTPETISQIFTTLIPELPKVEIGAHLHTTPDSWEEKVQAAWDSGCRRMDGALKGFGGCPMAKDDLTGNMPTENIVGFLNNKEVETGLDEHLLLDCLKQAASIMG